MTEKYPIQSEGEQLESFLSELEKEHTVKNISGWETGFANLSRALDGILPGLYFLIGPPACGKTSLAKQLLDQVALHNNVSGVFFTLAEASKELRVKTLARLSGLESREIRRGSAYLLHWYGIPKAHYGDSDQLPPSWDKLKQSAREAKSWLDLTYIVECAAITDLREIENCVGELRAAANGEKVFVVIDDCQRLGQRDQALSDRLPIISEKLQEAAVNLQMPILSIWPNLGEVGESQPQTWAEKLASPDVILVLEQDRERTRKLTEPNQAIILHVVKNRGGEKGRLAFDFFPAFSRFAEAQ
ncbi:MAG: DnaB-like helicase C-terminal domain-containing protein [Candidatus Binatia bacterium]|jgi:replicative DNA helicase